MKRGRGIAGVYIAVNSRRYFTDSNGIFQFPHYGQQIKATIEAPGYNPEEITLNSDEKLKIVLLKEEESAWFKIRKIFNNIINFRK